MDISIKKKVLIDMKKQSGKVTLSPFIQHDNNIIQLEILNDNEFPNFTSSTSFVVNFKRSDKRVFSSIQTPTQNIIEYKLTANDMEQTGDYELTLQIFEGDKRITSFLVQGKITKTLSANFEYEEKEYQPIVQQLLNEVISASGDFNSLNDRLNNMVMEGGGGGSVPSNVILFENWTSGESVTIGGTETDTTAPVLTITAGGTFTGTKTITMTTNEAATIYYTLDNSTPTANSSVYTAPLTISATTTLKAFAKDTTGNVSAVQTIVYSLIVPEPGDTTPPNNVTNLQVSNNTTGTSLTLSWAASSSSDVAGYDVYRGSALLTTITGTSYNVTGLTVNTEYTFTVKSKDTSNNVASGTSVTVTTVYVDNVAPVLTITPSATFTGTQTVTMSTNETATIYYTTNGDTPTVSSLVYSTPLTVTATTTIKAFAKDTAGNSSSVQTVIYTLNTDTQPSGEYVNDASLTFYKANPVNGDVIPNADNYFGGKTDFTLSTTFKPVVSGSNAANTLVNRWVLSGTENVMKLEFTWNNLFSGNLYGTKANASAFNPVVADTVAKTDYTKYYHVVLVRSGTKLSLYVDNVLVNQTTIETTDVVRSTSSLPLTIGQSGKGGLFKNVLYYNRALTTSEMTQNYNALK